MMAFATPAEMTKWTWVSMCELTASICRDLEAKKVFAFHTRIRQPEELYIRTLNALFIATNAEIPHILSGATPNGLAGLYTEGQTGCLRRSWASGHRTARAGRLRPIQAYRYTPRRRAWFISFFPDLHRLGAESREYPLSGKVRQAPTNLLRPSQLYGRNVQGWKAERGCFDGHPRSAASSKLLASQNRSATCPVSLFLLRFKRWL